VTALPPRDLYEAFRESEIRFFTGVPDSLLAGFCSYLERSCAPEEHLVAPNEGSAIGMATGHHLATGGVGVVYLQNSGLGNAINPLVSLADPAVYAIPMVLLIGWRGEPGARDEPQHRRQGAITPELLNVLEIPYHVLDGAQSRPVVEPVVARARERSGPSCLLVRAGAISTLPIVEAVPSGMTRESALGRLLAAVPRDAVIIATTGKTSRELFELRRDRGEPARDFLTVGSMGHASAIALGVALRSELRVVCIDGDGALLMHMGMLPTIGAAHPNNLIHVVVNNGVHESVGGHRTVADRIDFSALAAACGYETFTRSTDLETFDRSWEEVKDADGPVLWEIRVVSGSRSDLGRPTSSPIENKTAFMRHTHGSDA
jgi:phosphonopyruvate decarboxylase